MEYAKEYKLAMDTILHHIEKEHFSEPSITDMKMIDTIYHDILDGINASHIYVKDDMFEIIPLDKISYPESFNFKSHEIDIHIRESIIYQAAFACELNGMRIGVTFSIMKDNFIHRTELLKNMQLIYSWLYVCHKHANSRCGHEINIDIYFTSFKKGFPNSNSIILGPENVNSAYSTVCAPSNKIIIFRKEEWFKVFIHECGHSFGLEPAESSEDYLSNFLKNNLAIKTCIRVSESYVETIARIVNVFYSAILNSSNYDDFLSILKFTMKVESMFSVMQSYRVLAFMKMSYDIVITPTRHNECKLYKENSNVFAYYVICGAFMHNPFKFIRWCDKHNSNWLQFNNDGVDIFKKYILDCLHDSSFEHLMSKFCDVANRKFGLRFTITELTKN